MGLHFHGHGVKHYKSQERNEVMDRINAQANAVNPLDKLISDVEANVLKVKAGVPMIQAKERLDREARQFVAAIKNYRELFNKPINTPNATAVEPAQDERKVLTTKPKP